MFQEITIQFTEECNVSCPYCFAPLKSANYLSKVNFSAFMNFCKHETIDVFHVTGGEPTLNPNFAEYISELAKYGSIVVYTNFLTPNAVDGIVTNDSTDIVFLVNTTSSRFCLGEQKNIQKINIENALDRGFRIALSYTFYDPSIQIKDDIELLMRKMRKYRLRNLRLSQALSFDDDKSFYQKDDIKRLYHYIADNISEWSNEGLSVYFDCPVPPCYIAPSDFKKLREHKAISIKCIPKVFVMWNLDVTHCYSTMDDEKRSLVSFSSLADARDFSEKLLKIRQSESNRNGCYNCTHGNDGIPCGCPSYCV